MLRGDALSMTGNVGWLADHTVSESDASGGTPRFVKYSPFSASIAEEADRTLEGALP